MNYIKAQREVFNEMATGGRIVGFEMDGDRVCVTPDGFKAYIFPVEMIAFNLSKMNRMNAMEVHELIVPENQLEMTPIFRTDIAGIGRKTMFRLMRGPGKNVWVNEKYLACFGGYADPKFFQSKENKLGHIVVTEYSRSLDKYMPVGIVLPIRANWDECDILEV